MDQSPFNGENTNPAFPPLSDDPMATFLEDVWPFFPVENTYPSPFPELHQESFVSSPFDGTYPQFQPEVNQGSYDPSTVTYPTTLPETQEEVFTVTYPTTLPETQEETFSVTYPTIQTEMQQEMFSVTYPTTQTETQQEMFSVTYPTIQTEMQRELFSVTYPTILAEKQQETFSFTYPTFLTERTCTPFSITYPQILPEPLHEIYPPFSITYHPHMSETPQLNNPPGYLNANQQKSLTYLNINQHNNTGYVLEPNAGLPLAPGYASIYPPGPVQATGLTICDTNVRSHSKRSVPYKTGRSQAPEKEPFRCVKCPSTEFYSSHAFGGHMSFHAKQAKKKEKAQTMMAALEKSKHAASTSGSNEGTNESGLPPQTKRGREGKEVVIDEPVVKK